VNTGTLLQGVIIVLADRLPDLDYNKLILESRKQKTTEDRPLIRVALLSDAATQQFVPILRAILYRSGFSSEFYEGPFDAIDVEAYDSSSKLYAFQPDAVVILNSMQALCASYARRSGTANGFVSESLARITGIWSAIQRYCGATVIQSTYALPMTRLFGNFDLKVPDSLYSVALTLNAAIVDAARSKPGVLLHDVEAVASRVGRMRFFDERCWDMWKTFCAPEFLPAVAQNLADVLLAMRGRCVKCVVVDLDNTLWGGVIGDDGLDGIRLSAHGEGEAWYRLQLFLKEMHRRGILLAVCSKNDERNALLPFDSHPEMVLRREDITVFVANWKDKAENIRTIRSILNIGFDSMVFLDDNPFERNLVRDLLPGLIVPELPDDPADYVKFLAELNLFETVSFSAEDLHRAEMYKQNADRLAEAANYKSVEEFLQSLGMQITLSRFDSFHLPRIAQLIQRSNQFNLTTRRRSEAECERLMHNETVIPLYLRLSDRLGDHGLISVIILKRLRQDLEITDWLMSCRVLQRGVEHYAMNEVVALAAVNGLKRVIGRYIPTPKNGMVRDFFRSFDFRLVNEENGETTWELPVTQYQPRKVYMMPKKAELPMAT
jgi:FkbH-like protein